MHQHMLDDIARTAALLDSRGWAESCAGNMSVRSAAPALAPGILVPDAPVPFGRTYPILSGHTLFVTGTGTRMRDVAADPAPAISVLSVAPGGASASVHCAVEGPAGPRPTSELETHAALHARLQGDGRPETCIVHTHATEIIVLTQHGDYAREEEFNHLLAAMHPEASLLVPAGVAVLPYQLSGTEAIAAATAAALGTRSVVVWEKHGILAVGATCEAAFDLIDVVAKAIRIYLLCKGAGFVPEGLTATQIEQLRAIDARR